MPHSSQAPAAQLAGSYLHPAFCNATSPSAFHQMTMSLFPALNISADRPAALSLVGQFLHCRVFQVVGAESEHTEKNAGLRLFLDQPNQITLIGHANIEIAVGRENDTVHAAFDEIVRRDFVSELNPFSAVG